MEIIVLTIIFCFYIVYNEIHKRKIKNEKKEFSIPKDFYDNLKETFQFINYSLELIKQKQENINKLYIKMLELKKFIEENSNQKTKKIKKIKTKQESEQNSKVNINGNLKINSDNEDSNLFIEKLLKEAKEDTIELSFLEKKKKYSNENLDYSTTKNIKKENFFEKLGSIFRKTFQLPEIPLPEVVDIEEKKTNNIEEFESNSLNPISLEEYEKKIVQEQFKSKESDKNISSKQEEKIHQKTEEIVLPRGLDREEEKQNPPLESINKEEDPKEILLKESRKLFLELKSKEERIKFINKLIEIGFTEDDIHQITDLPMGEIILISKLKQKNNKKNI